jgi:hypothetical protein
VPVRIYQDASLFGSSLFGHIFAGSLIQGAFLICLVCEEQAPLDVTSANAEFFSEVS